MDYILDLDAVHFAFAYEFIQLNAALKTTMGLYSGEWLAQPIRPINSTQHEQPCQKMNNYQYFKSFSLFGWKKSVDMISLSVKKKFELPTTANLDGSREIQ